MKQLKYIIGAVIVGTLLVPYLTLQYMNWLYQTGLSFGWDPVAAGMAAAVLVVICVVSAFGLVAVMIE